MDGRMTRECWPVTTIASFDITIYTACICGGKECEPFRMIGNIACGTATCQVPVELLSLQEQLRTPTDFVTKRGWTCAHRCPMQLHAIVCAVSSVSSTLYAAHSCCTSCGAEESALMDLSDSFSHVQFLKCSSPQQCSACGYVSMEPDFSGHTFVPSQELWIQPLEDAHGLPGGSRALQQHLQVQLVGGHLAGETWRRRPSFIVWAWVLCGQHRRWQRCMLPMCPSQHDHSWPTCKEDSPGRCLSG